MPLKNWLLLADIGQREMARRLGYKGNGFVTLVANEQRPIPPGEIPRWADALGLKGKDRADFIDEFSREALPDWILSDLRRLRDELRRYRDLLPGEPPEPTAADRRNRNEEQARQLALYRYLQQVIRDRIDEMEGRRQKPKLRGGDPPP